MNDLALGIMVGFVIGLGAAFLLAMLLDKCWEWFPARWTE